jgi:dihydroorotase
MAATYDLILKGGIVVNQDGEGVRDIGVRDGRIAALGDLSRASAGETVDCRGLHVLPGVIDSHVHFREPGLTHKEDLESGSLTAVMGGVTAVFEMPNTNPLTISADTVADKVKRAHHRMHCDFAFYVGATRENTRDLGEVERLPGVAGVKVFMGSSTGDLLIEDDEGVRAVLNAINRRAAFHSEDEYRLRERMNLRVENDPRSHPVWRDATAALMATRRLMTLARFVDLTSAGPMRVFGIATKGRIAAGYDADFTVVDLKRRQTVTDDWSVSRAGWTPYRGTEVTGWPVGTVIRGCRVMWEGALVERHHGERVRFLEGLRP